MSYVPNYSIIWVVLSSAIIGVAFIPVENSVVWKTEQSQKALIVMLVESPLIS
jgi:hypothetical protein